MLPKKWCRLFKAKEEPTPFIYPTGYFQIMGGVKANTSYYLSGLAVQRSNPELAALAKAMDTLADIKLKCKNPELNLSETEVNANAFAFSNNLHTMKTLFDRHSLDIPAAEYRKTIIIMHKKFTHFYINHFSSELSAAYWLLNHPLTKLQSLGRVIKGLHTLHSRLTVEDGESAEAAQVAWLHFADNLNNLKRLFNKSSYSMAIPEIHREVICKAHKYFNAFYKANCPEEARLKQSGFKR